MGIDIQQLNRWSNNGPQDTAKATHLNVRTALSSTNSLIRGKDVGVFLQGSYINDTNIRGDSDVDIDVMLKDTWYHNANELSPEDRALFYKLYPTNAQYSWRLFRNDVLVTLRNYYGFEKVKEGNKCIKIAEGSNRLNADVVVSCLYRRYKQFKSSNEPNYNDGIIFWTLRDNLPIISYPQLHTDKLQEKNQASKMIFKPTVRIFKNARTYLEDKKIIPQDLAPSYFLECLLYNVPTNQFSTDFQQNFLNVWNWVNDNRIQDLMCPNGISKLFGADGWSQDRARSLFSRLAELWNNWGK